MAEYSKSKNNKSNSPKKQSEKMGNNPFMSASQQISNPFVSGESVNPFTSQLMNPAIQKEKANSLPPDYIIQNGDTLYSIASKHAISIDALLEANPALMNIQIGQRIEIPGRVELHEVKEKDTLYNIVKRYQVEFPELTLKELIGRNLQSGVRLHIPSVKNNEQKNTEQKIKTNKLQDLPKIQNQSVSVNQLLNQSIYTSHLVKNGEDLWRIASSYWASISTTLNKQEFNQLIGLIVDDIIERNNLSLRPDGKIEGFISGEIPALYIRIPTNQPKQDNKSTKKVIPQEEKDTSKKQNEIILTDKQSKDIGEFMTSAEAIMGLIQISTKYLGENNKIFLFVRKSIGSKAVGIGTFTIDAIKQGIDLYDGRYKGKPEYLVFDTIKLIASTNAYGAIIIGFLQEYNIDAEAFFNYCKKHNLSLPNIGESKKVKRADGTEIHYYQFNTDFMKYQNTFPLEEKQKKE